MPYATNPEDDVRIYYEVEGSGPPLVLAHGLTASHTIWRYMGYTEPLRERYQLVLVDLRGHGKSNQSRAPKRHGYRNNCQDILAVLDELSIDRAAYLGYSHGAFIGYRLAAHYPHRFFAMVLGAGQFDEETPEVLNDLIEWVGQGSEAIAAQLHDGFENLDSALRSEIEQSNAQGWAAALEELYDEPSVESELRSSSVPCLLYVGTADDASHVQAVERARTLIPQSETVLIDGLNHLQAFERSELVLPHVMEFLERKRSGFTE